MAEKIYHEITLLPVAELFDLAHQPQAVVADNVIAKKEPMFYSQVAGSGMIRIWPPIDPKKHRLYWVEET